MSHSERAFEFRDVGSIPVVSMPVECPGSIWPDANLTLFIKCPAELTVELEKFSYQGCWLHGPYCVAGRTTAYGGQLLKFLPSCTTITANLALSQKVSGISIIAAH